MSNNIRNLIAAIATALFSVTLFSALYDINSMIIPGVSSIYNELGILIAPNMVTTVIFDWRGYDTLGEALVLLTAVLVVLLVFGSGKLGGRNK
ncbi:EhbH [Methanobrevibacter sp. OttesenSCG-928-K11]|nr:EhbH [Methanobrevibacter sp. OttesenSCG-928-K11]MDL2270911.1 EhbH [Methanobrevibacter sp. OttesenSCG-928-I08]